MTATPADIRLLEDVGFLLSRISGTLARSSNAALALVRLKVRTYAALARAADTAGGMTQRELSEWLALDPSQVVSLVDGLVDLGLVLRRASACDRRAKHVVATPRGLEVRRQAAALIAAGQDEQLRALTAEEVGRLRTLLRSIAETSIPELPTRIG